ncbi:MAG TPA: class I lanthipeptide [Mycobacteriales bacterium]|jgi:uncharacterized protein (DUF849 family)|nr:class I lanthipeptide [Mycobacteriales bacterium]
MHPLLAVPGRTLTLRRETLAPLTTDQLAEVAGAAAATGGCPFTFHVRDCLSLDGCIETR